MASKRRIRRNACGGKIQYQTVAEATAAKHRIIERHGDPMQSYRCKFCRQWHLGHRASGRPVTI